MCEKLVVLLFFILVNGVNSYQLNGFNDPFSNYLYNVSSYNNNNNNNNGNNSIGNLKFLFLLSFRSKSRNII